MTQTNQSRAIASVARSSYVSRARPMHESSGVAIQVESVTPLNKIRRALPDGWHLANVTSTVGEDNRATIHAFPERR